MQRSRGTRTRNVSRDQLNHAGLKPRAMELDLTVLQEPERFQSVRVAHRADLVIVHGYVEFVLKLEWLIPEHTPEPEHVAAVHLLHL